MVENKELQEKMIAYRLLEAKLDSLLKQREIIASKVVEIQATLESIEEIEKSGESVLFPIGAEAYTLGKVVDKKRLIVEVGSGVALEKNIEEGKEILNKRREDVENVLNSIQKDIMDVSSGLEQLGPEIRKLGEELEGKAG